ncbi:MAG: hypothetical protein KDN05_12835 [Verrucomicrobiae bacterium]|nr:hypothetical protein [Verrucomicrobiae bacterium]
MSYPPRLCRVCRPPLRQLARGGSHQDPPPLPQSHPPYYKDYERFPLPELLTRIKIDLKRLFVTVIDHTTGSEHQLLFFKERFLSAAHPDRKKMARYSDKLRKLGLREEIIGYGPSKEQWASMMNAP